MTDPFANAGFAILGTDGVEKPIGGITPINGDCVIAAITFPSAIGGRQYLGDEDIVGVTLIEGVFYPIQATSITLTSGEAIGWLQS